MKILYAIQGTGNGHIARAYEVIPHLQRHGDVDLLVSGTQCDISLPWQVKYRYHGLSFIFGKKGGVDLRSTIQSARPWQFMKEVLSVPVKDYDLVLNDFEPVSAWACRLHHVHCLGISHQSAVLHPSAPKPDRSDWLGKGILKYYAPVGTSWGFHFQSLGHNISTPVIRDDVRYAENRDMGHYTVYLPSYSDEKILQVLNQMSEVQWQVFSKHNQKAFSKGNVHIQPVNKAAFTESLVSSHGVLCNAGFETPAEALFLGKKLLVIPMKGQYEQQCNAAFLQQLGVLSIPSFSKGLSTIRDWVASNKSLQMHYPDQLGELIDQLVVQQTNKQTMPELAL